MRSEPRERPELVLVAFPEVRALLVQLGQESAACLVRQASRDHRERLVPASLERLERSVQQEQLELAFLAFPEVRARLARLALVSREVRDHQASQERPVRRALV